MNLFFCRTPMHILRTIQLRLTIEEFKGESILVVFDTFIGADKIAERIKKEKIFNEVFYFHHKFEASGKFKEIAIFRKENAVKDMLEKYSFDKIIFFNIDSPESFIAYNKNKKARLYFCEDAPGLFEFYPVGKKRRILYWILGYKFPKQHIDEWWLSIPEETRIIGKGKKVEFPRIEDDKRYKQIVNNVFDFKDEEKFINADIIIFEQLLSEYYRYDDYELELYKKIHELYPEKKVVVKRHHGTKVKKWPEEFDLVERSDIPWEVFLMNCDFSKKILIAPGSSAVISPQLALGQKINALMLYHIIYPHVRNMDGTSFYDREYANRLEQSLNIKSNECKVSFPKTEEELWNILEKMIAEQ